MALRRKSSGSSLMFCLVLLVAFTLIGVALASEVRLQSLIQSNRESLSSAERAARATLAWGEQWLFSLTDGQRPAPCTERCGPGDPVWSESAVPENPEHRPQEWWRATAHAAGGDPNNPESPAIAVGYRGHWIAIELEVPETFLEALEIDTRYYRLLAAGFDDSGKAVSVVESIVARPWPGDIEPDALPPSEGAHRFCQRADIRPCGRVAWRLRR